VAKALQEWLATDVEAGRAQSVRAMAEQYFFRDPVRPQVVDSSFFFAPADGVILYQRRVQPDEALVEIKGKRYTLREALRDDALDEPCLVIGIFMTMYDVHVNRIPYAGTLSYRLLPPLHTHNRPMLALEQDLVRGGGFDGANAGFLFTNQRMLNTVRAPDLGLSYHLLQIADYEVATIQPFEIRQVRPVMQNQRFSQIRFGSQVDLILPLSARWSYETLVPDHWHVEAGLDPLVRLTPVR
jgi:phosphatidylserine decarboxylase